MAANIVQHFDKEGNKQYPITTSAAVGMSDGKGNLDEKLAELSSELEANIAGFYSGSYIKNTNGEEAKNPTYCYIGVTYSAGDSLEVIGAVSGGVVSKYNFFTDNTFLSASNSLSKIPENCNIIKINGELDDGIIVIKNGEGINLISQQYLISKEIEETQNSIKTGDNSVIQYIGAKLSNKLDVSLGKNKFNKEKVENGIYLWSDGTTKNNNDFNLSAFISIKPNIYYTVSNTGVGVAYHGLFDENFQFISSMKDGTFTSPENGYYLKLTISNSNLDSAQLEEGESATTYEPYTENFQNEKEFAEINESLNNIREEVIALKDSIIPTEIQTGKNLLNKEDAEVGYLRASDGTKTTNSGYKTVQYIPVEGGKQITASPLATGPIGFCEYDEDKAFIKSTTVSGQETLTITTDKNCRFVGASFFDADIDKAQVEYGSQATEYEPYTSKKIISPDYLPGDIGNGITEEEAQKLIDSSIDKAITNNVPLVLPSNLYFKMGRINNLYFRQAIKCSVLDDRLSLSTSDLTLDVVDELINIIPTTENNFAVTFIVRDFEKEVSSVDCNISYIDSPSSPKTVSILDSGNSISDLGRWQVVLKKLLETDNVTVNYVGTMINRVNIGSSNSPEYVEDIWGEVLSGGNLSFLTENMGAAKILTVSNITELPETGYPGTSYLDDNGNSWVVRGFKLVKGEDGKYSGKLKLGKFKSDPNYGDGSSDDTSSSSFPESGTITKTKSENGNTLAGDDTINYSNFDDARFNPFWNPNTDELDFKYYFDYWGFSAPDIYILQFSYNDVGNDFSDKDSDIIQLALQRLITVIDKFHSQYQSAKIVVGIECYGSEIPKYSGNKNLPDNKKYSTLSFMQAIKDIFENSGYSDYVTIVPIYAYMNHKLGYGPLTEKTISDVYSKKKNVLTNGVDGVHPYYNYGMQEIGRAYEPVVLSLLAP